MKPCLIFPRILSEKQRTCWRPNIFAFLIEREGVIEMWALFTLVWSELPYARNSSGFVKRVHVIFLQKLKCTICEFFSGFISKNLLVINPSKPDILGASSSCQPYRGVRLLKGFNYLETNKWNSAGASHPLKKAWTLRCPPLKGFRRFPLNIRAVKAKIKLHKKNSWHGNILNTAKKNLSRLQLSSWPPREKIEFEVAHILLKTNFSRQFKVK